MPLAQVKLNVQNVGCIEDLDGDEVFDDAIPYHLIYHFTVPWVCAPHPRNDRPHDVEVMEREDPSDWQRQAAKALTNPRIAELGDAEAAFRELWPERKGEDWRSDWHSFPLAESETR